MGTNQSKQVASAEKKQSKPVASAGKKQLKPVASAEKKQSKPVAPAGISPLRSLYHNLDRSLRKHELEQLKFLVSDTYLSRKDGEHINSARYLFAHLEEKEAIGQNNLTLLVKLFKEIGRYDLKSKVETVETSPLSDHGDQQNQQTTAGHIHDPQTAAQPTSVRQSSHQPQQSAVHHSTSLQDQNPIDAIQRPEVSQQTQGLTDEAILAAGTKCREWLEIHYKAKMNYTIPIPCESGFRLPVLDLYTDLEWVIRNQRGAYKKCKDFRQAFATDGATRILIEGNPGIGKSTFCRKIALDWANKTEPMLERFKLLIVLELRQLVESGDIIQGIFDQLLPTGSEVERVNLQQFMTANQRDILIVLDGADELKESLKGEIMKLVEGKLFPLSTVIISSRSTERGSFVNAVGQHFIIKGYTPENLNTYIHKYFDTAKTPESAAERAPGRAEELISVTEENESLASLASNPLNAVLLCLLWEDCKGKLPDKRFDLYTSLVVNILKRHSARCCTSFQWNDGIPETYSNKLFKLGKMAYHGLVSKQLRFDRSDVREFDLLDKDDILQSGLLYQEYSSARLTPNKFWVFLHKAVQEYMAAYYLVCTDEFDRSDVLDKAISSAALEEVVIFIAGQLGSDGSVLFERLACALDSAATDYERVRLSRLSLSCLYESGHTDLYVSIIAPKILRDNSIVIDSGPYLNRECLDSLTNVINYHHSRSSTCPESRLLQCDIFGSYATPELLQALSEGTRLESLSCNVSPDTERKLMNVFDANKIKQLTMVVDFDDSFSDFDAMSYIQAAMSKLNHVEHLFLPIADDRTVTETNHSNDNIDMYRSMLCLSESVQYVTLYGNYLAELALIGAGESIAQHNALRTLTYCSFTNALLTEKRLTLSQILQNNGKITTYQIGTEVIGNDTRTADSRRASWSDDCRWKTSLSTHEIDERERACQAFYNGISENQTMKVFVVDHNGEDRDLISICRALSTNPSVYLVIIVAGFVQKETSKAIVDMMNVSKNINIICIISQKILHMDAVPAFSYQQVDVGSNSVCTEGEKEIVGGIAGPLYWLLRFITDLNITTGSEDVYDALYANMLQDTIPSLQSGGHHVNVWKRNT